MQKIILFLILVFTMTLPLVGYSSDVSPKNSEQTMKSEKKPLYWVDTMEPSIHYSAPGKSRMGMELVPVYSEEKKNPEHKDTTPLSVKE